MFLRNEKFLLNIFFIILFLFSFKVYANNDNKTKVINYLSTLKNFSASFLQNDVENLSEGKIYVGKNRVRAEYFEPNKILIILDEEKAMYYNYELEEDEFFNPKNTNAWFFYDVFRNPLFFIDGMINEEKNELILEKKVVDKEGKIFVIKVCFENKPIVLRRVEILNNKDLLKLSIYNHNYNEEYNRDFFKLISPKLLN